MTMHMSAWFGRGEGPPAPGVCPIRQSAYRAHMCEVRGPPFEQSISRLWSRCPRREDPDLLMCGILMLDRVRGVGFAGVTLSSLLLLCVS